MHPAARPGHLMTLVPLAGRRHRRSSLLTRPKALRLPSAWRMPYTASQARRATRSLQETLVADLPGASEPSRQEGVPPGPLDVNRALS